MTTTILRIHYCFLLVLGLAQILPNPAWGNDTASSDHAGRIQFIKEEDISIQKEVLRLTTHPQSPLATQFYVAYEMKNESSKDKKVQIAFPLPEVSVHAVNMGLFDVPNRGRPLDKRLTVDDKSVEGWWVESIHFKGKQLKSFKSIKQVPSFDAVDDCDNKRDKCSSEQMQACRKLQREFPGNSCMYIVRRLMASRIYRWNYTFPAGKKVNVVHEYSVGRGSTFYLSSAHKKGMLKVEKVIGLKNAEDPFCLEKNIPDWKERIDPQLYGWSEYILSTGSNWKGPIRHFELHIDPGPNDLASSCFPGLKKIEGDRWQATVKDFSPDGELAVGFFSRKKSEPASTGAESGKNRPSAKDSSETQKSDSSPQPQPGVAN